jgi:hypothetical protein
MSDEVSSVHFHIVRTWLSTQYETITTNYAVQSSYGKTTYCWNKLPPTTDHVDDRDFGRPRSSADLLLGRLFPTLKTSYADKIIHPSFLFFLVIASFIALARFFCFMATVALFACVCVYLSYFYFAVLCFLWFGLVPTCMRTKVPIRVVHDMSLDRSKSHDEPSNDCKYFFDFLPLHSFCSRSPSASGPKLSAIYEWPKSGWKWSKVVESGISWHIRQVTRVQSTFRKVLTHAYSRLFSKSEKAQKGFGKGSKVV